MKNLLDSRSSGHEWCTGGVRREKSKFKFWSTVDRQVHDTNFLPTLEKLTLTKIFGVMFLLFLLLKIKEIVLFPTSLTSVSSM
jgi:hypothetical protein